MAETDSLANPVVILVEPQLGENIGTAARAMANFGLSELRLVNPRDGWPNEKAVAAASRADHVVEAATLFDTVEAAIADLTLVLATTARERRLAKPVIGPVEGARQMLAAARTGGRAGVLFGRERVGLLNDEVALADAILTLPVAPEHASLNIAQAVLVIAYEWRKATLETPDWTPFLAAPRRPASKEEMLNLFEHLEAALDARGFFRPPQKRAGMIRNLRTMLARAGFTGQEVKTLRGAIAALEGRPTRPTHPRHLARPGGADPVHAGHEAAEPTHEGEDGEG